MNVSPALTPDIHHTIHTAQPFKPQNRPSNELHIFLEMRDRENWFFMSCNCRIACTCTLCNFTLFFNKTFRIFIINRLPTQHIHCSNWEIQNDDEEEEITDGRSKGITHYSCSSKAINSVGRLCEHAIVTLFNKFILLPWKRCKYVQSSFFCQVQVLYTHIPVGIFLQLLTRDIRLKWGLHTPGRRKLPSTYFHTQLYF